jgi:hypothetical protein
MVSKFALGLLFTTVVCLASATTLQDSAANEQVEAHYILASLRGALQGFERGLYGNSTITINALCLADDSANNVITIFDQYEHSDISNTFSVFLATYNLQYSLDKFCGTQDIVFDLVNFLADKHYSLADFNSNVGLKFFTFTGAFNNIGLDFYTNGLPPTSDTTAYFNLYQTVGLNLGNVLRTFFDFTLTTI